MSKKFGKNVFVLMPFNESFLDVYELGIKAACDAEGWACSRVDEHVFSGLILEQIYDSIKNADLIVADMSEKNPNVFYEVGYAHALNKRVILLTRDASDIPFDLTGHRHIVYNERIKKLRDSLEFELGMILSENPFKDFLLGHLTFLTLEQDKNSPIVVDNFISLDHGSPTVLSSDQRISVPGEISNYGKGVFFEFSVIIRNESRFVIDLSDTSYRISFPEGVALSDGSLKLGHGKLVEEQNDGRLVVTSPMSGTVLQPGAEIELRLFLRSTVSEDGSYQTVLPVHVSIARRSEWKEAKLSLEFSPIRRMN